MLYIKKFKKCVTSIYQPTQQRQLLSFGGTQQSCLCNAEINCALSWTASGKDRILRFLRSSGWIYWKIDKQDWLNNVPDSVGFARYQKLSGDRLCAVWDTIKIYIHTARFLKFDLEFFQTYEYMHVYSTKYYICVI